MNKTLCHLPDFKVWRNDRFWLAGDHVVDPRTYDTPLNRRLIDASDTAARDFKLTDYKGPNVSNFITCGKMSEIIAALTLNSQYTIIHTEFVRQRAEPGLFVLGADSRKVSTMACGG